MSEILAILCVIGLVILCLGIVVFVIWMFIIGIYDTFVADKASFWSITYLVVGFIMTFGGSKGGSKIKRRY